MSRFDDFDYGQDDYGDFDTEESIRYIRSKLDKALKISDDTILTKLELSDWNEDKAIKLIKASLPKAPAAATNGGKGSAPAVVSPKGKASPATGKSVGSTPSSAAASKSAVVASEKTEVPVVEKMTPSDPEAKSAGSSSETPDATVVATNTATTVDDLDISDDDLVTPSVSVGEKNARSSSSKPELTMIVVGHVDAGKSTLVGNLLHKLGEVSQKTIHKYAKDSKAIGKASFSLAWVMDERKAERERGVTIDIAEKQLSTSARRFTILDAPGHKDFVPNMIKGAAQADVALLVVPATAGEYETCMSAHAQTREHAILLKALGVNQVLIVVNKMDATQHHSWQAERYYRIEAEVRSFLVQDLNFHDQLVRCVPMSGLTGENLLSMSNECPGKAWYHGPTLQAMLDTFHIPPAQIEKPLRAVVTEWKAVSKQDVEMQICALQGQLSRGRSVGIVSYSNVHSKLQSARVTSLKSLAIESEMGIESELSRLTARERATVRLTCRQGFPLEFNEGDEIIVFKGPPKLQPLSSFRANITSLNTLDVPIMRGSKFEIYLKGVEMQCSVVEIESVVGTNKKAKCVPAGKNATVVISLEHPTVVESFSVCRALGRFALRWRGNTIAVGQCE